MAYEKLYNEIFAIVSLKYFWTEYQPGFVKNESPDWINMSMDLGIEVSQAMLPGDGETESFIEYYLGSPQDEIPPSAFDRYGDRLYFYNGRLWAVLDEPGAQGIDFSYKILFRFQKKLEKLNSNYRRMGKNCLYLYAHSNQETVEDIQKIAEEMAYIQQKEPARFNLVFLEFDRALYVVDLPNGQIGTISIPGKAREFLSAETEYLRHCCDWPNGTEFDGKLPES